MALSASAPAAFHFVVQNNPVEADIPATGDIPAVPDNPATVDNPVTERLAVWSNLVEAAKEPNTASCFHTVPRPALAYCPALASRSETATHPASAFRRHRNLLPDQPVG